MRVACVKTFLSQSDSFVTAGDAMAAPFINGEIIQSAERVIPAASAATLVSPSIVDLGSDKAATILGVQRCTKWCAKHS